jgi:hypothetical protein
MPEASGCGLEPPNAKQKAKGQAGGCRGVFRQYQNRGRHKGKQDGGFFIYEYFKAFQQYNLPYDVTAA